MQTGTAADEARILAQERHIRPRVLVDWNGDGGYSHPLSDMSSYAEDVTIDRSLKGSLPTALRLVEGSAAAELTVTLSGRYDGILMDALFSQFNGDSPLYSIDTLGKEIKVSYAAIAMQAEAAATEPTWFPQFVGNIQSIQVDRAEGTATIVALDRVEKLRRPVPLTSWALMNSFAAKGVIESQLVASHWFIDDCLRFCDTSASKYRHPTNEEMNVTGEWDGAQFWLTGNGGAIPTIGWMDGSTQQQYPPTETSGVQMYQEQGVPHPSSPDPTKTPQALNALRAAGNDTDIYWAWDRNALQPGGTHWAGFTLVTTGTGSDYYLTAPDHAVLSINPGCTQTIAIMIGSGKVWATYQNTSTGQNYTGTKVSIPAGSAGVRVRAAWDLTAESGLRMYCYADAAGTGWETKGAGLSEFEFDSNQGRIKVTHRVSLQDIYYTAKNVSFYNGLGPSIEEGIQARYAAVLDRGRNRLSFIPNRTGDEAWTLVTEVAEAEFGAVFWDETGVLRFWNRDTMVSKQQTPVRALSLDDLSALSMTNTLDSVRNQWSITAKQSRMIAKSVYQSQSVDDFYIPGGTGVTVQVWVDGVVTPNSAYCPRYSTIAGSQYPQWNDDVTFGYVLQFFQNGAWAEDETKADGFTPTLAYRTASGAVVINIFNQWDVPLRFATNSGSAALRWNGSMVVASDDQVFLEQNVASIREYGGRTLAVSGDWYQEMYNADSLITDLVAATAQPTPTTDAITIPGDPRLQLGDCLEVDDAAGFGEQIRMQVIGINRKWSVSEGLTDVLTVEIIRPPRTGIFGSEQYGRLGQTFYFASS